MTLPDERYRALMWASRFLKDIAYDKKKYPRIPKTVRQEAYSILRHFPDTYIFEDMTELAPQYFAKEMEPLYRMIKQHEQDKESNDNQERK